jgi:hypothetical protein
MTTFIDHIIDAIKRDGAKAMEIFPEEAGVLVAFVDRIGMDVVSGRRRPIPAAHRVNQPFPHPRSRNTSILFSHKHGCHRLKTCT